MSDNMKNLKNLTRAAGIMAGIGDARRGDFSTILAEIAEQHGGVLLTQDVVEAARDKDHPLHSMFEWDDNLAAEEYRRAQ